MSVKPWGPSCMACPRADQGPGAPCPCDDELAPDVCVDLVHAESDDRLTVLSPEQYRAAVHRHDTADTHDATEAAGLSEIDKAYNVAQAELFQLAAYGHHRYAPLHDRHTGKYLTTAQIEAGQQAYNTRIWEAEYAFEAAVLRKAAAAVDNPASAQAFNKTDGAFIAARASMAARLRELADQVSPPATGTAPHTADDRQEG